MSHRHRDWCPSCDLDGSGKVFDYCGADECDNPYCVYLRHCDCLCHSGKTCTCGYIWPQAEKKSTTD